MLIPLLLGIVLMAVFFAYECAILADPTLPLDVLNDRTGAVYTPFFKGVL